ncbi:MAG: hypothetical protein QXJ59_11545 [Thermofilaceae archaeon]
MVFMMAESLTAKSFYELARIAYGFLHREYSECTDRGKPLPTDLPDEFLNPEVIQGIFPDKSKKLREELINTLKYLINARIKIIKNIDRVILDNIDKKRDNIGKKRVPITNIVGSDVFSTLEELSGELLVLSLSRSFASALLLQLKLNESIKRNSLTIRLRRVGEVELGTGVASPLHMAWAWLADRRVSYVRSKGDLKTLLENKDEIRDTFSKIINDNSMFHEVYRSFMEGEQGDLANVLRQCFPREEDSELRTAWANYFARLIFGVKEALEKAGFKPSERILKNYINACMINHGFFEYELYSLLVNEEIPAIPKLEVHYRSESQETAEASARENMRELDILAMDSREYLTQVEVTTTTDSNELRKEIERGPAPIADRLIVVAPEDALERINCWDYDVVCVPLEKPYGLIDKLRG